MSGSKSKTSARTSKKSQPLSGQSRRQVSGRGAYYVKGHIGGEASIPGFGKAHAGLEGGIVRGLGAYDVSRIRKNIFLRGDPPSMRNTRYMEGGTIIRHREYLGDIVSSATANTFNIQSYPLNPAQQATFPWLSPIARQYEEYMVNGILFEFKSTCSDAIASSNNLALGNIMMASQYDPLNPPFISAVQMLNYEYAQSCKVSESALHMIECDPRQSPLTHLYTRPGTLVANADLRLYDFATFYVASSGLQGTSINLGQLWVTYEFILFKPKVSFSDLSGSQWKVTYPLSSNYWLGSAANIANMTKSQYNDFECIVTTPIGSPTPSHIQLPLLSSNATYFISINYNNLTSGLFTAPSFGVVNGYLMKQFNNNAAYLDFAPTSGTNTTALIMNFVVTTGSVISACVLQIAQVAAGAIPGSGATGQIDIIVTPIAYLDPVTNPHL